MPEEAFFVPQGDAYAPTELTRGPWDPDSQHAGPPAALIGREIERLGGEGQRHVGRITFEILRAVPIAPLRVEARVVRPGRSVELVEASLSDSEGEVIRARAWRLRSAAGRASRRPVERRWARPDRHLTVDASARLRPTGSGGSAGRAPFRRRARTSATTPRWSTGSSRGTSAIPGPALVWMRMRQPLVAGEEPSPLQRVLVAADSGNGVSATLDWGRYLFINVDLTVHLHRPLEGEWVCLDSITIPEPGGAGLADTALYDGRGPIGRAAQTLLIDER